MGRTDYGKLMPAPVVIVRVLRFGKWYRVGRDLTWTRRMRMSGMRW